MELKTRVFQVWVGLQKTWVYYGKGDHGQVDLVSQGHGFKPAHERVESHLVCGKEKMSKFDWGQKHEGFVTMNM